MESSKSRGCWPAITMRVAERRKHDETIARGLWGGRTPEEHRRREQYLRRLIWRVHGRDRAPTPLPRTPTPPSPTPPPPTLPPPTPPPPPDPPATGLLRTLLGPTVPPEPPAATKKGLVAWWGAVVEEVDKQRQLRILPSLDEMQQNALCAVSEKAKAASAEALPRLYQRFKARRQLYTYAWPARLTSCTYACTHTPKPEPGPLGCGLTRDARLAAGGGADHNPSRPFHGPQAPGGRHPLPQPVRVSTTTRTYTERVCAGHDISPTANHSQSGRAPPTGCSPSQRAHGGRTSCSSCTTRTPSRCRGSSTGSSTLPTARRAWPRLAGKNTACPSHIHFLYEGMRESSHPTLQHNQYHHPAVNTAARIWSSRRTSASAAPSAVRIDGSTMSPTCPMP